MSEEKIPADLRIFLLRHIDSVAQLEALVLLSASPQDRWTSAKLASRLYISEDQALPLLHSLAEDGFVDIVDEEFSYTGHLERRQTVRSLADFYASHIVAVTQLIHSKPRRIREFANAFRLKKDR
jgi:hypothetical protein